MNLEAIHASALSDVGTSPAAPLGTLRQVDGNIYKYVAIKNVSATVAGAAGDGVAYGSVANGGRITNTVVIDLTDADTAPVPAGILQGTVTGTAGTTYYGWIQIKGLATINTAITNGADGSPIRLGTSDKTFVLAVEADSAGTYKMVCGIDIDDSAKIILCDFPY